LQRFTNSNERPDNGWNRCVTRTRSGYFPPAASHAVDGPLEQHRRAGHPHDQAEAEVSGCLRTFTGARQFCAIRSYLSTASKHGIGFLDALIMLAKGEPWIPATA
jgi:hypothetical protein